jgi:hypothetical protein
VFGCLKEGCPWACGTRRSATCAERFMAWGLGAALVVGLLVSLSCGVASLSAAFAS